MLSRDVPSSWGPCATMAPPAPRLCASQPPLPCMGLATNFSLQTLCTGAGSSPGQGTEEKQKYFPLHIPRKSRDLQPEAGQGGNVLAGPHLDVFGGCRPAGPPGRRGGECLL